MALQVIVNIFNSLKNNFNKAEKKPGLQAGVLK
jgi:hypothetical protein